jgi:hypothetical protein
MAAVISFASGVGSWLGNREARTSCVGKVILLPINSVLQSFGFATSLLDSRLHSLGGDIVVALRIHRDRPGEWCRVVDARQERLNEIPGTKRRCRVEDCKEERRCLGPSRAQGEQSRKERLSRREIDDRRKQELGRLRMVDGLKWAKCKASGEGKAGERERAGGERSEKDCEW